MKTSCKKTNLEIEDISDLDRIAARKGLKLVWLGYENGRLSLRYRHPCATTLGAPTLDKYGKVEP